MTDVFHFLLDEFAGLRSWAFSFPRCLPSAGQGIMAPAGEEHGVRNHTQQRLTVLVFVAPNPV
jgi:hypothetical protein